MPTKILLIYYLAINLILFLTMGIDKLKAKREAWRIPESTLFVMSLLGGALGGFIGMFVFHHKKNKIPFYIIYFIALVLHAALIYLLFTKVI